MLEKNTLPLFFGKSTDKAIIEPEDFVNDMIKITNTKKSVFPKKCIISFFNHQFEKFLNNKSIKKINWTINMTPMIILEKNNEKIGYVFPGFGTYAATFLDRLIALGMEKFVVIGTAGTLDEKMQRGELIIPEFAIIDEGFSYHYIEPSRYSYPSKKFLRIAKEYFDKGNIKYKLGGTWTTEALHRETFRKRDEFLKEGCLTVEMETSALFSVAACRKRDIIALFSAGDCIGGKKWNSRKNSKTISKIQKKEGRLLDYAISILTS
ncbi:MAG: nucleoside phosphorylase [Candidatus Aenigmarchaeota archaeon]|nr:nucleoside phosphorylase [Candidatus Aenigmarchaeota archaeon]NCO97276.1 nucleoside phosphorylase [Candidatus Aenigmarchaeota archaeon]PIW41492.1 MAG: hypothetical protein COW21_01665 [Candidatus Aenigmarchaeota archaeon CG15_BIG_FIL_POST_REV_8_21_14_020_37_27]PIY35213.1 MAG: hypothetical protein COZ04_04240 [Candidatus Aenigmarchaeota archaeon CG_4_10_14_3_um_filter_37_21]PJB76135.1 MAG: hypothetical protein CO092_00105 [Candidatus Aenigmarchaeota archaeon CG_4_9_14_3_um_filter_37_18]